jgi:hypothetical protein
MAVSRKSVSSPDPKRVFDPMPRPSSKRRDCDCQVLFTKYV